MGSDSEALDGTVKTVAKKSIVALSFKCGSAYEVCGLREMLRPKDLSEFQGPTQALHLFLEGKMEGGGSGGCTIVRCFILSSHLYASLVNCSCCKFIDDFCTDAPSLSVCVGVLKRGSAKATGNGNTAV